MPLSQQSPREKLWRKNKCLGANCKKHQYLKIFGRDQKGVMRGTGEKSEEKNVTRDKDEKNIQEGTVTYRSDMSTIFPTNIQQRIV